VGYVHEYTRSFVGPALERYLILREHISSYGYNSSLLTHSFTLFIHQLNFYLKTQRKIGRRITQDDSKQESREAKDCSF
jgi:hypothetical protein